VDGPASRRKFFFGIVFLGASRWPPQIVIRYVAEELVTEHEYFGHLEMRVSRELAGMRDQRLRGLWCDGFVRENFVISPGGSHVAGRVWIADGQRGQALWNFVLLLGRSRVPREQVNWAALLLEEEVTGWLYLDFEQKFVKVKLSAAHPDGTLAAT
jgi:hypothetical protein